MVTLFASHMLANYVRVCTALRSLMQYICHNGKPEGKRPLEDQGVDGRTILNRIFKKWDRGMDWIDLPHDRDRWRALVNAVMNFRVP